MKTLLTYDITDKHVEFKSEMLKLGYLDRFLNSSKTVHLPNTTLIHKSKDATQCTNDASSVSSKLKIKLERCICTQFGLDWAGIFGEPF